MRYIVGLLLLSACWPGFENATYVHGLRVLAVKAEPPEAAPGSNVAMQALVVDTDGAAITADWVACTLPAVPGTGQVNPLCLTTGPVVPLGSGLSVNITVPDVVPLAFGPADETGGVYLPLRLQTRADARAVDAMYRLRLLTAATANTNPKITEITASTDVLEEANPPVVHLGDRLSFKAKVEGAETFGVGSRELTELLRVSWFVTGGTLSEGATGQDEPTVWRARDKMPAPGEFVEIYAVARDERGGIDFAHRRLQLE